MRASIQRHLNSTQKEGGLARRTAAPTRARGLDVPDIVREVLSSPGRQLDAADRAVFESRFGQDFSRVRVHDDSRAVESARVVEASAYTVERHVVFDSGRYAADPAGARRTLAHELTHVAQQGAADVGEDSPLVLGRTGDPFEAEAERVSRETAAPAVGAHAAAQSLPAKPLTRGVPVGTVQRQFVTPHAAGGGFGGMLRYPVAPPRAPSGPPPTTNETLHFYHGTRWSIAQNIGRIEPRGIGDFAAGFYTHFEPSNNPVALNRAKERGRWASRQDPPETYAGVLDFQVPATSYQNLLNTNSRVFPLADTHQRDYATRQREWLDYVTTHGRQRDPSFFMDVHSVERWRHFELQSPEVSPQAVTVGPFYTPRPGLPGPTPPRDDFRPKTAEGQNQTRLMQQVVWAREGIDLLNASTRDVLQFRVDNGDPVVPPVRATFSPPQRSEHYTSQNPSDE
jgi:hypothetical protein